MATLAEIAAQLKEPFPFDDIDFLPKGKVEREGKTLCMALPYADPRVYQDRLNAVAYGEWSTPAPVVVVAGSKLICYVTIILCGVSHTDVGEADPGENQGTEAFAQAFKRAASQFGLGRYLYDLEKEWVPFNPQRKQIELDTAGKRAIVRKMYQKAGIAVDAPKAAHNGNGHKPEQHEARPAAQEPTADAVPMDDPASPGAMKQIAYWLEKLSRPAITEPLTQAQAMGLLQTLQADYKAKKAACNIEREVREV